MHSARFMSIPWPYLRIIANSLSLSRSVGQRQERSYGFSTRSSEDSFGVIAGQREYRGLDSCSTRKCPKNYAWSSKLGLNRALVHGNQTTDNDQTSPTRYLSEQAAAQATLDCTKCVPKYKAIPNRDRTRLCLWKNPCSP